MNYPLLRLHDNARNCTPTLDIRLKMGFHPNFSCVSIPPKTTTPISTYRDLALQVRKFGVTATGLEQHRWIFRIAHTQICVQHETNSKETFSRNDNCSTDVVPFLFCDLNLRKRLQTCQHGSSNPRRVFALRIRHDLNPC